MMDCTDCDAPPAEAPELRSPCGFVPGAGCGSLVTY